MKKISYVLFALICFAASAHAQKRETVLVDYFGKGRDVHFMYSEKIRSQVIEGFLKRNREDVIDADRIPAMRPPSYGYNNSIDYEKERNEAIANTGARYLISGTVADYKFAKTIVSDKPQYTSIFRVVLNGYDMALGLELSPEQYELTGRGVTPDEADWRAITSMVNKINFYVQSRMKFETPVLQIAQPDSKGRSLDLYIGSGTNIGVKRGDQFIVYAEDMIQGRAIRTELGKITVSTVNGTDASLCTMKKKQAADIISAFNAGKRLVAVSAGEALFTF